MGTKKRKKFKAVSKFNELIDQIFRDAVVSEETDTGSIKLKNVVIDMVPSEKVLKGRTVFEYMKEDIDPNLTQEEYDEFKKDREGKFLIYSFQLAKKLTKAKYNRIVSFSNLSKYDLQNDSVSEEVEELFYDSFDKIISDGKAVDIDYLSSLEMIAYMKSFTITMQMQIEEFKKK